LLTYKIIFKKYGFIGSIIIFSNNFYHLNNGLTSYEEAAKIYFKCRKNGIAISSTIDCLIARTCIENDIYLLHDDKDFDLISKIIEIKIY